MRNAIADEGEVSYGIEGTPYSEASDLSKYFGYVQDEVDFPGGHNPHVAMNSAGTSRKPHHNASDNKEYEFDIPVIPYNENIPLEVALGSKTQTDITNDSSDIVGQKYTFEETNTLPTMTVAHAQQDLGVLEKYIGAKASLSVEAAIGDPLTMTLECMAQSHTYTESPGSYPATEVPSTKDPYRFHMRQGVMYDETPLLSFAGFSFTLDNGLEAQHHGDNAREPYSIVESTSTDKYDLTLTSKILDLDLFKKAADDSAEINVTIPFVRGKSSDGTINDSIEFVFSNCTIASHNLPLQNEGALETDIELMPTSVMAVIKVPAV